MLSVRSNASPIVFGVRSGFSMARSAPEGPGQVLELAGRVRILLLNYRCSLRWHHESVQSHRFPERDDRKSNDRKEPQQSFRGKSRLGPRDLLRRAAYARTRLDSEVGRRLTFGRQNDAFVFSRVDRLPVLGTIRPYHQSPWNSRTASASRSPSSTRTCSPSLIWSSIRGPDQVSGLLPSSRRFFSSICWKLP